MKKYKHPHLNNIIMENIKYLIRTNGMIQNDFARICDSNNGNVSKWCSGIAMPPINKIAMICNHFNITIDDFVLKKLKEGNEAAISKGEFATLGKKEHIETLDYLIKERKFLHTVQPFRINSIVITKLEEALMWLEKFNNEANNPASPDKHHKAGIN